MTGGYYGYGALDNQDINHDGIQDLIWASLSYPEVRTYLGHGDGTFTLSSVAQTVQSLTGIATAPGDAVDRIPPVGSIDNGPALTRTALLTVTGNASDAGGIASVQLLDNGNVVASVSPGSNGAITAANLAVEGANDLVWTATDRAGNHADSAHVTVTLDTGAPTLSVRDPAKLVSDPALTLVANAADTSGIAGVVALVNGTQAAAGTPDGDGNVSLQVTLARDEYDRRRRDGCGRQHGYRREDRDPRRRRSGGRARAAAGRSRTRPCARSTAPRRTTTASTASSCSSTAPRSALRSRPTRAVPSMSMSRFPKVITRSASSRTTRSPSTEQRRRAPPARYRAADGHARALPKYTNVTALCVLEWHRRYRSGIASASLHVEGGATATDTVLGADGTVAGTLLFAEGPRRVVLEVTDRAGNVGATSADLVVDTTPPTVAVSSPLDGAAVRHDLHSGERVGHRCDADHRRVRQLAVRAAGQRRRDGQCRCRARVRARSTSSRSMRPVTSASRTSR